MKLHRIAGITALLAIALGFTSCPQPTDSSSSSPSPVSYTIMTYGVGGTNGDAAFLTNLRAILEEGTKPNVKFTAQLRFSKAFQVSAPPDPVVPGITLKGTQRFSLEPGNNTFTQEPFDNDPLDDQIPIYSTKLLTDFINWSKTKYPADKYILIFMGHGSGWAPDQDPATPRLTSSVNAAVPDVNAAILYDDNVLGNNGANTAMGITETVKAIKDSGVTMEVVYYNACLINMLENLAELREVANYCLATDHVTPMVGGHLEALLRILGRGEGTEESIAEFCAWTMERWNILGGAQALDITLTDLRKLDGVLEAVKKISRELIASKDEVILATNMQPVSYNSYYANIPVKIDVKDVGVYFNWPGDPYDSSQMASQGYTGLPTQFVYYPQAKTADIYQYVRYLEVMSGNPRLIKLADELLEACAEAIVYGEESDAVVASTSFGITLVSKDRYENGGYINSGYKDLRFNRETNWADWLSQNELFFPFPYHDAP